MHKPLRYLMNPFAGAIAALTAMAALLPAKREEPPLQRGEWGYSRNAPVLSAPLQRVLRRTQNQRCAKKQLRRLTKRSVW